MFALFNLADTSTAHAGCSESELASLSLANWPIVLDIPFHQ